MFSGEKLKFSSWLSEKFLGKIETQKIFLGENSKFTSCFLRSLRENRNSKNVFGRKLEVKKLLFLEVCWEIETQILFSVEKLRFTNWLFEKYCWKNLNSKLFFGRKNEVYNLTFWKILWKNRNSKLVIGRKAKVYKLTIWKFCGKIETQNLFLGEKLKFTSWLFKSFA